MGKTKTVQKQNNSKKEEKVVVQVSRGNGSWVKSVVPSVVLFAAGTFSSYTYINGKSEAAGMPSDYHCTFGEETCDRGLKANKQYQAAAKEAIEHIWQGHDNVDVVTGKPARVWVGAGIFVMDSLTTLWLADMKKEFYDCVEFIRTLDWNKVENKDTSFFEVTIRALGGLLGAYDLSGEKILLTKAVELADKLCLSFTEGSPFPNNNVNFITGHSYSPFGKDRHFLAEIGTFQMEFRSLTYHTGDTKYQKYADDAMLTLLRNPQGLLGIFQSFRKQANGLHVSQHSSGTLTIGGGADSYYEYLLKLYLQTNQTEPHWLNKFQQAYQEGINQLQSTSNSGELTYWGETNNGVFNPMWEHLSCFMSGTLTLGNYILGNRFPQWKKTALDMSNVCHEMYRTSPTGLAAERVSINQHAASANDEMVQIQGDFSKGILRPEAVESWYYLHYFTGDPKYREWANQYLENMNKHARTNYGYSELDSVYENPPRKNGNCESFVMAETVKYLYLIQSDRATLDLSKFVLNTEAHPLKIMKDGLAPVSPVA